MALTFLAIDPATDGDNCPAVFIEDETGDLLFQGCDGHRSAYAQRGQPSQPARRHRIGGEAPGPHAGDHLGGPEWLRCHRSAS